MPRGGHNAKPTNVHHIHGTKPRAGFHPDEPQPQALEDLTPPAGLDTYGKEAWARNAPILRRNGLLTEADVDVLFGFCDAYAQLRRANNTLRRRNLEPGERRGASADRRAARHDMRMFAIELGMSPAARGRLHISTGAAAGSEPALDPMEEILSGRRGTA